MATPNDNDGPTPADRMAGLNALNESAIAGALRILASQHLGELDHAHLPIGYEGADNNVSVVAVDRVKAWLEGWAIRIENGADL